MARYGWRTVRRNPDNPVCPVIAVETTGKSCLIQLVILMFRKKDGGISVVAKKRSAIGTFF
jgi:hypothetical protein